MKNQPVLVIILATLVVVGAGVFVMMKFAGGLAAAKAGECVMVSNQQENRADVSNAGCNTDKAFKVGKILGDVNATCPEEASEYYEVMANSGGGKLCLLPNFVEGGCYTLDDSDVWGKSACSGDAVKITKVVSGDSEAPCPENEEGVAYPEPPVSYCFKFLQPQLPAQS